VKLMAHRFRGYRGIDDPKLKKLIATLEYVDDIPELVEALEKVNVSALANMTDDPADEEPGGAP